MLPATLVFAHPTAAALTEAILERLIDQPIELLPGPIAAPARREVPAAALASVSLETAVPASFGQERLWFLQQLHAWSHAYHELLSVQLTGRLDLEALGDALAWLLRRHEPLRTALVSQEGQLVQQVQPAGAPLLVVRDLQTLSGPPQQQAVQQWTRELLRKPFDLQRGRVMRTELGCLQPDLHVLVLAIHHIAIDGWSIQILLKELAAAYRSFASQGVEPPPAEVQPLTVRYSDYARWERSAAICAQREAALAWWRDTLRGAVNLNLPTDRAPATMVRSDAGGRVRVVFDGALTAELRALAQAHGVTPFMLLLAIWQTQLCRYTAQTDVVVGTVVANRPRSEFEPLVGFFVNTLALRTDLSGDPTFEELLRRVKQVTLDAFAHELAPFEQVVAGGPAASSGARTLQVLLVVQSAKELELVFGPELSAHATALETEASKFDLLLDLTVGGEAITGHVEYSQDLFERATIERLVGHLLRLAADVVASPSKRLSELEILTQTEREQLMAWASYGT